MRSSRNGLLVDRLVEDFVGVERGRSNLPQQAVDRAVAGAALEREDHPPPVAGAGSVPEDLLRRRPEQPGEGTAWAWDWASASALESAEWAVSWSLTTLLCGERNSGA